jgi:hypothetical protein
MGVDVIYNNLNTVSSNSFGSVALTAPAGGIGATSVPAACPLGVSAPVPCYRNSDMDSWMATFRVQRDFLP